MNKNSMKGNAAEHFVLYKLMRAGVPCWQTGGNNKRWDIFVQTAEDAFVPASVKFASTWLPIFSPRDESVSGGIYFIVGPKKDSDEYELLMFPSSVISEACIRYRERAVKTASYKNRKSFRNMSVSKKIRKEGLENFARFIKDAGMREK